MENKQLLDGADQLIAHLLVEQDQTPTQVKKVLVGKGMDEQEAMSLIRNVEEQIEQARRARAKRDVIFGSLWTVGGTVMTLADIGFIFWGAIVFGFIQLIRGIVNLS